MYLYEIIAFMGVILIAAIIGVIDDIFRLGAIIKPILLLLAGLPLIFGLILLPAAFGAFEGHPILPFIGPTRLNIVYLPLTLLAVSVCANSVNMIDVMNGAMPTTSIISLFAIIVGSVILGSTEGIIFSIPLIGALLAYLYFNRFPANVFSGDVGSLTVGAAIGAIAVLGHVEVVAIVAMMPQISNSFAILSSIGKLVEGRNIRERPTQLRTDGLIQATNTKKAPITLTRMVLAWGPLQENEIVWTFSIISIGAGVLAVLTALLLQLTIIFGG